MTSTAPLQRRIALIAHDDKKRTCCSGAGYDRALPDGRELVATESGTARQLRPVPSAEGGTAS